MMKYKKRLLLKIIGVLLGTLFTGWLCFLVYDYGVDVKKIHWQQAAFITSIFGLFIETLVINLFFGLIINMEYEEDI